MPFPPPGDLLDLGIESVSLMSPKLAGGFFTTSTTGEALPKCEQFLNHKQIFYLFVCTASGMPLDVQSSECLARPLLYLLFPGLITLPCALEMSS